MSVRPRVQFLDATSLGQTVTERPAAIVIGNFDGVHRGHQAVIRQTLYDAEARGLETGILTFDPHPATVVAGITPSKLTSLDRRIELLGDLGVPLVYVCRFDRAFADIPAENFARSLLSTALRAEMIVVGANFRFGANRGGDLALLERVGKESHFEVKVHDIAADAAGPFSSTRARNAIAAGDIEATFAVLGRPHELTGVVVGGLKLGRAFGFPTANLSHIVEMLPANGVYCVRAYDIEGGRPTFLAPGVMNIGVRPTLGGALGLTIEAHLLDFDRDLYGRTLRVTLESRLREERRFSGPDALKDQIRADVAEARRRFVVGPI